MSLRGAQAVLLLLQPPLTLAWTVAVWWRVAPASYAPILALAALPVLAVVLEPFAPAPRSPGRVLAAVAELGWSTCCALAVSVAIVRRVGW